MSPPSEAAERLLPLLRDGPRQAHDLAERLGIDTSAVRRHLDALRGAGLVRDHDEVSGPGRPKKLWTLTGAGEETFRRDYALLLGLLMDKLAQRRGRDELLALLGDIARDVAAKLPPETDPARRLDAVARLYNDLGFEAHLERDPRGAPALVQRNCILLRAARARPDAMCDCFDEGILRAALPGARVELAECMATGDARCRHVLHGA